MRQLRILVLRDVLILVMVFVTVIVYMVFRF